MLLNREAPDGFQAAWHRVGHAANCRHCRCTARVAFRDADPGFWMLKDREDENRPAWWRQAIGDYIENAPRLVRFLAGAQDMLRGGIVSVRNEELSARPVPRLSAKGPLRLEGSNYDGQYPRQRVASILGENDLVAVLWRVSSLRKRPDGEPEESDFVIEVNDLNLGQPRVVQTGLSGRRSLILSVDLSVDYRGLIRGEVTVTFTQAATLLSAGGGELQVLPPVELPDGEAAAAQDAPAT
jgi:hypothetical protein